ncbi:MAG: hypothetical protein RLZZ414_851 [Bacteroidota bacterium]|jgi:SAM-dependent methyltransferase
MEKQWFETWFDTEEYHQLYKNRDEQEASAFINKLINFLQPDKNATFLDIACGKGRHAKQINDLGFKVVGYDLSKNSIYAAQKLQNEKLSFYTHDMRKLFWTNYFDYAFNLFTSFGYFDTELDEKNAMLSATKALKNNGTLVIDFLNKHKVIADLIPFEIKNINQIDYHISKTIQNNQVIKTIQYQKNGQSFEYTEKVKLLAIEEFENYLQFAGLKIQHVFGNYDLQEFTPTSSRLIIVAKK